MTRRYLSILAACFLLGAAACGDDAVLSYRTNGAGQFEAHFVDSSDTLLVLEADEHFQRELRFFSPDGDLIVESSLEGSRMLPTYYFLLVDRYHIAVPALPPNPPGYRLAPPEVAPSSTAQSFLRWIEGAGGLLEDGAGLSAATNPYANLSCAVGADGSIAVWDISGASPFRASAATELGPRDVQNGVFCLRSDGRAYVMTIGMEGARFIVQVFEAGAHAPTAFRVLEFDGRPVSIGFGRHAAVDAIVGLAPENDFEKEVDERPSLATRIVFGSGAIRAEHARLNWRWPEAAAIRVNRNDILVTRREDMRAYLRFAWGADGMASEPQTVVLPSGDDFHRRVARTVLPETSPSGQRTLWVDRQGELRLERSSTATP